MKHDAMLPLCLIDPPVPDTIWLPLAPTWILTGKVPCRITVGHHDHLLEAESFILVNPPDPVNIYPQTFNAPDYSAVAMYPSRIGLRAEGILSDIYSCCSSDISVSEARQIRRLLQMMMEAPDDVLQVHAIAPLLIRLLCEYGTKSVPSDQAKKTNALAASALAYIHAHYREQISLVSAAEFVHATPNHLSAVFKKYTGRSFSSYVSDLRLNNACILLAKTNTGIESLAADSGFSDSGALTRALRAAYGLTPSAYRKQQQAAAKASALSESDPSQVRILSSLLERTSSSSHAIRIQTQSEGTPASRFPFLEIFPSCSPQELLNPEILSQISAIQSGNYYRQIYVRNVWGETYHTANSDFSEFNFTYIDNVLYALTGAGLTPIIDLGFKFSHIRELKNWQEGVEIFLRHLMQNTLFRGKTTMLYFGGISASGHSMLSSLPEAGFLFESSRLLCQSVKQYGKAFKAASPEFDAVTELPQALNYLSACQAADCMPCMLQVFWHPAAGHTLREDIERARQIADAYKIPLYVSSWYPPVSGVGGYDSIPGAIALMQDLLSIRHLADGVAWCRLADPFPADRDAAYFQNKTGLITYNGITKPMMRTMRMLNALSSRVIAEGDGFLITKDPDSQTIIGIIYTHPGTQKTPDGKTILTFEFESLPSRDYLLTEYTLSPEHGCALRKWQSMGAYNRMIKDNVSFLNMVSEVDIHYTVGTAEHGMLRYTAVLPPSCIRSFELVPSDEARR